jgi:hypothetical protein
MTFGEAMTAVAAGEKARRQFWACQEIYIFEDGVLSWVDDNTIFVVELEDITATDWQIQLPDWTWVDKIDSLVPTASQDPSVAPV